MAPQIRPDGEEQSGDRNPFEVAPPSAPFALRPAYSVWEVAKMALIGLVAVAQVIQTQEAQQFQRDIAGIICGKSR